MGAVKHSSRHLGLKPSELGSLLLQLEDAWLKPGDYYLCAPPGLESNQPIPSVGPQQSLQTATASGTSIPTSTPTISLPLHCPDTSFLSYISPSVYTPDVLSPPSTSSRPPDLTSKPLKSMGLLGHYHIPSSILHTLLPSPSNKLLPRNPIIPFKLPPIPSYSASLESLVLSMMPNFIKPISVDQVSTIPLYHGTAFSIPKPSSNKLSLIINLAAWNDSQIHKPPAFSLPSIKTMRAILYEAHWNKQQLYFSKWDLSNFYWSCQHDDLTFRFPLPRADGSITLCQLDCLPFGWDKAPWLGQSIHSQQIDTVDNPDYVDTNIYLDDGLAAHTDPSVLSTFMEATYTTLQQAGFVMSPKSEPEPTLTKTFIGKLYTSSKIANSDSRLVQILLLLCLVVQATYLTPTYLEKLLGTMLYAVAHSQSYASLSFLRHCADSKNHMAPHPKLRSSLAAAFATAMVPWEFQGFPFLKAPTSSQIYIDGSPTMVGLVTNINGTWQTLSTVLPAHIAKLDIAARQQNSELYSILCAIKFLLRFHSKNPPITTLIMDSNSSIMAAHKGSTTNQITRARTLMKIQFYVNKYKLILPLAQIDTKLHPADIPSRTFYSLQPVDSTIQLKIDFLTLFPGHINSNPKISLDLAALHRDAWATPASLRKIILNSPHPPTLDLFADPTTTLTPLYFTMQHPWTPTDFHKHVLFFQPPYSDILFHWKSLLKFLPSSQGIWGLIPASTFTSLFNYHPYKPRGHICHYTLHVDFTHPHYTSPPGAKFDTVIFFISPSKVCLCPYFHTHFDDL